MYVKHGDAGGRVGRVYLEWSLLLRPLLGRTQRQACSGEWRDVNQF